MSRKHHDEGDRQDGNPSEERNGCEPLQPRHIIPVAEDQILHNAEKHAKERDDGLREIESQNASLKGKDHKYAGGKIVALLAGRREFRGRHLDLQHGLLVAEGHRGGPTDANPEMEMLKPHSPSEYNRKDVET